MQNENNTREILGQLAAASQQMAAGFERAAELTDQSERHEAYNQALAVLGEMRHAVMVVATGDGVDFTFHPNGDDVNVCENCCKTSEAHMGEDCKCP